jgi:hypothetical protein
MTPNKAPVLLMSLVCFFAASALSGQDTESSMRRILGAKGSTLFTVNDKLVYIGDVVSDAGERYLIAYVEHFWGNNRATNSLVVFDAEVNVIGQYGFVDEVPSISGISRLVFPFPREWGNTMDFSNGIPPDAYLDGAAHPFLRLN